MHEHDDTLDRNILEEMGYEKRDVNVGKLGASVIIFLAASTLVMFLGLFFMIKVAPQLSRVPEEKMQDRRLSPQPPAPLIQSNATAKQDLVQHIKSEREALNSYAWSDRKRGFVRIPVDEAMKRMSEKGLPSKPGARIPEDGR